MFKRKDLLLYSSLIFFLIVLSPLAALAVPSLGVSTNGTYFTADSECDPYQLYFASDCKSVTENSGAEGFGIGISGSELNVFTYLADVDIYLFTTVDVYADNSPTFDGSSFTLIYDLTGQDETTDPTGQIDGYKPQPYYAINLGKVDNNWNPLPGNTDTPSGPFEPENFYGYTGILSYTGEIAAGSYFFAVADLDDNGIIDINTEDIFSPKTTSAAGTSPIPEPGTLMLLGGGLIGAAAFGRRRFSK